MISGKPVWAETSVTASPASISALAEPPVESSATPRSARKRAKATRPVLSETEISARVMGISVIGSQGPSGGGQRLGQAVIGHDPRQRGAQQIGLAPFRCRLE